MPAATAVLAPHADLAGQSRTRLACGNVWTSRMCFKVHDYPPESSQLEAKKEWFLANSSLLLFSHRIAPQVTSTSQDCLATVTGCDAPASELLHPSRMCSQALSSKRHNIHASSTSIRKPLLIDPKIRQNFCHCAPGMDAGIMAQCCENLSVKRWPTIEN